MSEDTIYIKPGEKNRILDAMQNLESLPDEEIVESLVFEGYKEIHIRFLLKAFRNPEFLHSSSEIDCDLFEA